MSLPAPNVVLREARERAGLGLDQVAGLTGLSVEQLRDLEAGVEDVVRAVPLGPLARWCRAVGTTPRELFGGGAALLPGEGVDPFRLVDRIRDYLVYRQRTVAEFEAVVGWSVGPALAFPEDIQRWPAAALRAVCDEVDLDWLAALPA